MTQTECAHPHAICCTFCSTISAPSLFINEKKRGGDRVERKSIDGVWREERERWGRGRDDKP